MVSKRIWIAVLYVSVSSLIGLSIFLYGLYEHNFVYWYYTVTFLYTYIIADVSMIVIFRGDFREVRVIFGRDKRVTMNKIVLYLFFGLAIAATGLIATYLNKIIDNSLNSEFFLVTYIVLSVCYVPILTRYFDWRYGAHAHTGQEATLNQ
ncbi:MAG: hypothetical protein M1503_05610 [Thaumarchaeota archaeon]|nr:hypothetical protein [Nitrososphaerota archaeon]MCL5317725.1 hypothetical protein [Nitrososphaerota archaeon]